MTEYGNEGRSDELFFLVALRFKDIDSDRVFVVRRIEIDNFVGAVFGMKFNMSSTKSP